MRDRESGPIRGPDGTFAIPFSNRNVDLSRPEGAILAWRFAGCHPVHLSQWDRHNRGVPRHAGLASESGQWETSACVKGSISDPKSSGFLRRQPMTADSEKTHGAVGHW